MAKLIHIPKIGHVEFPDEMEDKQIAEHASGLHSNVVNEGISKFMGEDPAIQGLPHSEKLKELSAIAALMEKYPRLAGVVDKGIEGATSQASEQTTSDSSTSTTQTP